MNVPEDSSRHILDWLSSEHEQQEELCLILEEIADALPGPVDRLRAKYSRNALRTDIPRYIAIQERYLFPLMRRRAKTKDNIDALIQRITIANSADEGLCYDTADQLEAAIATGRPKKPDMLAYMLRGLFEGRRRHIEWEHAVMIPLARKRLKTDDLRPLSAAYIAELAGLGRR